MLRTEAVVAPHVSPGVLPQVVAQSALLELTALELEERVTEELEENPALELDDETLPPLDYMPAPRISRSAVSYDSSDSYDTWANLADGYTLKDDLKQQFRAQNGNGNYPVAELLIEAINEDGYLTISVGEAAEQLAVDYRLVELTLQAIHELSPQGLGARDLCECLRLQLGALDSRQIPDGVEAIVDNMAYLTSRSSVGGSNPSCVEELRGLTKLSGPQIQRALDFIRKRLCPYPGRAFQCPWSGAGQVKQYAYPDVVLALGHGDQISILIPQSERLAMRVNAAYKRLDDDLRTNSVRTRDESLKEARRLVRMARQFIDNLTRRYRTMYKVMAAIVEEQKDFIVNGPAYLQPLSKKGIAAGLGYHEATVCRATKDKYVLMPDGRLEKVDMFFDDALPAKSMIRRLVNSEDKSAPLSDRRLQEELAGRGFELARRTVTKYRLQLDVPPASQRRAA